MNLELRSRAAMTRELIYHQDAINREALTRPPLQPGDHATTYADMLQDPAVAYSVGVIKEAVLAEPWTIQPADPDDTKAVALAADVEKNFRDLDLEPKLEDALNAIWRGFWAHEIVWKPRSRKYWLSDLAAVDPDQIALELDRHMKPTAILSVPNAGPRSRLPAEKMWLHVHSPSRLRPAGFSILEPAYRAYSAKNRLLQFWGNTLQRFGGPCWKLIVPANTNPARQTALLEAFAAGRLDGVYLVPEDVTAEVVEPSQFGTVTFETSISYQDAEIARSILLFDRPAQTTASRVNITGLGLQTAYRASVYRISRISRELSLSINRQIIQPLCLANYGAPAAVCPRFDLPVPDSDRIALLADAYSTLVTSAITDPATAAEQLGLPPQRSVNERDSNDDIRRSGSGPDLGHGRHTRPVPAASHQHRHAGAHV